MGTWGLTKTELSRLDAHHRRHLRQIIGIRWPHRISNDAIYRRTHSSPISAAIRAARWSLFGHVLRLPLDAYLEDTGTPKFRGRPRCTLPTTLGENLRHIGRQLRSSDDINALRTLDRRATTTTHQQHTNTPTHQHSVGMGQHGQFGLGGCSVHTSITQQPYIIHQHTNTLIHQHTDIPIHQHTNTR